VSGICIAERSFPEIPAFTPGRGAGSFIKQSSEGYMFAKKMNSPDEVRNLPKTKVEVVKVGDSTIMRGTFEPGWKWSECVKPTAGTKSCQAQHVGYVLSGRMKVVMDNGVSVEIGPGDAVAIPPGHDAWVVGNESCVMIDFGAGTTYGKKA
jgi:ethanolamine utilization protein EutQ (cupin superfamily)